MKQLKALLLIPCTLLAFLTLTSCDKFDEGGLVRQADDRILSAWKLNTYLRNGVDETSTIQIKNYREEYLANGTYNRSYTEKNGNNFSESGKWELKNDNKEIHISSVSSIKDFSSKHSTLSSSKYDIIRLTKSDLWYSFENGGARHEFRFIK